jgi:malate dehydrogenase (oxaloacetate-decarboxylating)
LLTVDDVRSMAKDPIVFAMANPNPEIRPELITDIAAVIATGRRLPEPDQQRARVPRRVPWRLRCPRPTHHREHEGRGGRAIASVVGDDVRPDFIIPSVFERGSSTPLRSRRDAAIADGVCRQQ